MKTHQDPLDKKLEALNGPGPARRGEHWPTHRSKARDAKSKSEGSQQK